MKTLLLFMGILFLHSAMVSAPIEMSEIARLGRGTGETVSWRPDGEIFAVGGSAGLWLFDANYRQTAHFALFAVQNLEFSPNGHYLAVSDTNSFTELWRLGHHGELLERSAPLPIKGDQLQWSSDNRHVSALDMGWPEQASQERRLEVWDITTETLRWALTFADPVFDAIWSPDGEYLAVASWDGRILLLDSASGETVQTLQIAENLLQERLFALTGIAFQKDRQALWLVFAGSNRLGSWDLNANEWIESAVEMRFLNSEWWGLQRQPDGHFLTSAGVDGSIYVLSEETGLQTIHFNDSIADYAWRPGLNRLSILTGNGMVREYEVLSDTSIDYQLFTGSGEVEWSPDSQWLLQITGTNPADSSYPVMVWKIAEANLESYQPDRWMYPYLSAKWAKWLPESEQVMLFSDNTVPHALCLVYAIEQWHILEHSVTPYWEASICGLQNAPDLSDLNWNYVGDWTGDFGLVAAAHGDEIFVSIESSQRDPIQTLAAQARVTSVAWSPKGTYLLAISANPELNQTYVEVWQVSTGDRVVFFPMTQPVVEATWSPDEHALSLLIGHDADYTLSVIDTLTGHTRFERSFSVQPTVQWKPDGSQLAVISTSIEDEGESVDLLESATGVVVPLMPVNDGITFTGIDWHPSEDWLAVSTGKALLIYDIQTQTILSSIDSEGQVIAWSPNGTNLAVRYPDQKIGVWAVKGVEIS